MSRGEFNFIRQGTAMSEYSRRYTDARPTRIRIGEPNHQVTAADFHNIAGLRYSSPRPWILALAISLSMWALIAWLIWRI